MSKNFKIWGVSYGLIGDLIMGLPVLTYFERKYPNSYKFWGIEKKCAFTAPLFLNHLLIDRIVISNQWNNFDTKYDSIINTCDVKCTVEGWKHQETDWYNYRNQVEETARLAGIFDLKDSLTSDELKPKLVKWFEPGLQSTSIDTGSKNYLDSIDDYEKVISIWPFSTGDRQRQGMRCPSEKWWLKMVSYLIEYGFKVFHFGLEKEALLSTHHSYKKFTNLNFFDQIKLSLATPIVIATDSGPSWVFAAYSHPCIVLMTNWMHNHNRNFEALLPLGDNVRMVFEEGGCDKIKHHIVLKEINV